MEVDGGVRGFAGRSGWFWDCGGVGVLIPLEGVRVLDFSTLLPGPLATLILAEAGARVTKIERPGRGDEIRTYEPRFGESSVNFALLNRGKESLEVDLKSPDARDRLLPLIEQADVLVEQFRPGVMDRLGLGYEDVSKINPGIVYCSITGYGQSGPRSGVAAHDLNYVSEAGLLSVVEGPDGAPVLPPVLLADIGGGTYPAVINILLALFVREKTGEGAHLDISMSDNVFPFLYWAMGNGTAANEWPKPGGELVTGGSPRYNLYRAADGGYVAAARIAEHPAEHWREQFREKDVCCSIVRSVREAMQDEHFRARGLFDREVEDGDTGRTIPALPLPLAPGFLRPEKRLGYPALGEADGKSEAR